MKIQVTVLTDNYEIGAWQIDEHLAPKHIIRLGQLLEGIIVFRKLVTYPKEIDVKFYENHN